MARQPRVVVPGLAHYVLLRGLPGTRIFVDDTDREDFLRALRGAVEGRAVQVHAYALLDDEVHLLLRPEEETGLARAVQTLGRRFVAGFNRRHGRSGTLWDGRYRTAVVEPGPQTLQAMTHIDARGGESPSSMTCSAAARTGGRREAVLRDPPEYWSLGNTPFDREAAYRALLGQPLPAASVQALAAAVRSGWVFGSADFTRQMAQALQRPMQPRARGRPRRALPAGTSTDSMNS